MTTFVLLRIEDDDEAQRLLDDMQEYPGEPLLTPSQENTVHATLDTAPSGKAKCSCNRGPDTYGPEQDCPEHGDVRVYAMWLDQASDAYNEAAVALNRVEALHRQVWPATRNVCADDSQPWPCRTIRAMAVQP